MESPRASRATADPKDADAGAAPRPLDPRIVLGIDPGTRVVGFGAVGITARGPVLLGAGAIRTDPAASMPSRLGALRRELDRILSELRPGVVVVEEAFAHRNVQSALRLGEGRGVVLSCASAAGVEVEQIPPAVAKKVLVGFGAAHKTQVAAMVARMLSLDAPPQPLDATDALALALTHVVRRSSARIGAAAGRALRR
jgi:crossover junction endodeoxyribonuclease RuvC